MSNISKEKLLEFNDNTKPIGIFIKTEYCDLKDDSAENGNAPVNNSKFDVKVEENGNLEVLDDGSSLKKSIKTESIKSDMKIEDAVLTNDSDPLDLCAKYTDSDFSYIVKKEPNETTSEDKSQELVELVSQNQVSIQPNSLQKNINSSEKQYVCDKCNLPFNQIGEFDKHKLVHIDEKTHICSQCDKQFKNKSQVVKHKRTHSGEKSYICDVCEKNFTSTSNLTRHRRIHTGVKPFSCNFCKKLFTDPSNLKKHQIVHKNEILGLSK